MHIPKQSVYPCPPVSITLTTVVTPDEQKQKKKKPDMDTNGKQLLWKWASNSCLFFLSQPCYRLPSLARLPLEIGKRLQGYWRSCLTFKAAGKTWGRLDFAELPADP
ncbi:hypothetical protein BaRGS_00002859 [Batillaria attramentaria]|uniref:Uncharacterized protein n=1 Tax=Batillaria attramentaria TaxID=370345 RepID=A0ABD0M3D5_9CAEN